MTSESDQNPIGNLIRNLGRIPVGFLLKILNWKMTSESDLILLGTRSETYLGFWNYKIPAHI
jgi:hypothetical protein